MNKAIRFPKSYSARDKEIVKMAILNAHQDSSAYDGDYSASWLLSNFDDMVWHTTQKGREEFLNGEWKGANNIYWGTALPNGKRLSDPPYRELLSTIKKACFLVRHGVLGKIYGSRKWMAIVREIINLTRWLVLHQNRYMPEKHCVNYS